MGDTYNNNTRPTLNFPTEHPIYLEEQPHWHWGDKFYAGRLAPKILFAVHRVLLKLPVGCLCCSSYSWMHSSGVLTFYLTGAWNMAPK